MPRAAALGADRRPRPRGETTDTTRTTWRALGTNVDLVVTGGDVAVARTAVAAVLEDVDRTYSRFRPDSELVALNARAGQTVQVSPLLADAIDVALRAAYLTDGLCDPTVGKALRRIGYDDDFATILARADPIRLWIEPIPGWQTVAFDRERREMRAPVGVELDLGSTGKAYAADLAVAAAVDALGGAGALVGLGGDIAVSGASPDGGWRVLAAEDSTAAPDGPGEVVVLASGGLATSSTMVRRWLRGGVALHHLVDPRTGLPAVSPWRTVSVIATTCVDANAAATAGLIGGELGPDWLHGLQLPARFVRLDGTMRRVGGWPEPVA